MLQTGISGGLFAYYRVSTDKQGRSGLGLDAQREAIRAYAANTGGQVSAEFVEVESGKRSDRPELAKAIEAARKGGGTLVIAKLDRLARNTRFLLSIVESGANVAFCDLPQIPAGAVGKFMLTQMAAVAELEAGLISERTKAALAAAKARGVQLGNPNPGPSLVRARAARSAAAQKTAENLAPVIQSIKASGVTSLRGLADALNARGLPAPAGGRWFPATVNRVLQITAP